MDYVAAMVRIPDHGRGREPLWQIAWPGAVGGAIGGFVVLAPIASLSSAVLGALAAAALGGLFLFALSKMGRDEHPPTAAE